MTTFAATSTDTQTWVVTGFSTCAAGGCSQDAAIIAAGCNYARFCLYHTDEAAAVALSDPVFKGWYRIIAGRYDHTQQRLALTVCPL